MTQNPPAPQFGNWDEGENVPYSAYFERVRKGRNHMTMNSNSPEKTSDAYEQSKLSSRASSPKVGSGMHEPEAIVSRPDQTDSPTYHFPMGRRTPAGFPSSYGGAGMPKSDAEVQNKMQHQNMVRLRHERLASREDGRRKSANYSNRSPRRTSGSEYSAESPSYYYYNQASPSRLRESSSQSSHGVAPTTPQRSRFRSVAQGDKTPDHEAAVPKFGEWNEKDASSGDGYTQIFNRVRDEKQHGAATSPAMKTEQNHSRTQVKADGNKKPQKCWCFPW